MTEWPTREVVSELMHWRSQAGRTEPPPAGQAQVLDKWTDGEGNLRFWSGSEWVRCQYRASNAATGIIFECECGLHVGQLADRGEEVQQRQAEPAPPLVMTPENFAPTVRSYEDGWLACGCGWVGDSFGDGVSFAELVEAVRLHAAYHGIEDWRP